MDIFRELNYPHECEDGSKIPKKSFYEEAKLKTRDQKIFIDEIEKITWTHHLKPEIIKIPEYTDKTRNYPEVEIIHVKLREDKKLSRITDIILRTIPYPILLILEYKGQIKLYVSHIREHGADSSKITLEKIIHTEWIDLENKTRQDENLFKNLKIENLNKNNMYEFYNDIINQIIIHNASKIKGQQPTENIEKIKEILEKIDKIEIELLNLKIEIDKENNFSKKVNLNSKAYKLKEEKKKLIQELN